MSFSLNNSFFYHKSNKSPLNIVFHVTRLALSLLSFYLSALILFRKTNENNTTRTNAMIRADNDDVSVACVFVAFVQMVESSFFLFKAKSGMRWNKVKSEAGQKKISLCQCINASYIKMDGAFGLSQWFKVETAVRV